MSKNLGLIAAMLAMSTGDQFSTPRQKLFKVGPCKKAKSRKLKKKKVGNHFSYN